MPFKKIYHERLERIFQNQPDLVRMREEVCYGNYFRLD